MAPISSSSLVPNCRPCQLNKAVNSDYRRELRGDSWKLGRRTPRHMPITEIVSE
jgi:hypothetical protein